MAAEAEPLEILFHLLLLAEDKLPPYVKELPCNSNPIPTPRARELSIEELRANRKKQLKKDTTSKIKSLVDESWKRENIFVSFLDPGVLALVKLFVDGSIAGVNDFGDGAIGPFVRQMRSIVK
ncbi:hypothetical protein RHGRI_021905 [Rhododendron griersonianum]|uniref:Uncharacterized protein n=1 Tax=Rhododendron griersonianum TaxID=479676 RepID=A0AAV6JS32_9ERIC|nr:hypothetical protein RHGRI_021905 [Rhododendron griersonianum]